MIAVFLLVSLREDLVVIVYHLHNSVVVGADFIEIVYGLVLLEENVGAHCDSYVVASHPILGLVVHKLLKELADKLQCVVVQREFVPDLPHNPFDL